MTDLLIVLCYFLLVFIVAIRGRLSRNTTVEAYFLSSRNLRWPSIAISTIATNVQGYQFLGMMGSAYLYGLAQANLEINAMQGLLLAAFVFVPLYLKDRVITVTQFIQKRLGHGVGLAYSAANLLLFSTIGLGAALFWGAYAADAVFGDLLGFIHEDRFTRTTILLIGLGVFSAVYTYFGGLAAVVKTDIIQFVILTAGGVAVLVAALSQLGGWDQLYERTPDLMHLHLPADHETLPWIAVGGWFLLNINYWCANQSVVQRSLAARSLKDAQVGLMVGGVMKYFMAVIIIVPGIALAGLLTDNPLADPDETFPYLVREMLQPGWRGLILCALFASLMSTVDSTFNSLATLFSIDIYRGKLRPEATDRETVRAGRLTILVTLVTGILTGIALLYAKLGDSQVAFTHTLNEIRYYVNCGIVVIICAAAFLYAPRQPFTVAGFLISSATYFLLDWLVPDLNYFVRAMFAILLGFAIVAVSTRFRPGRSWLVFAEPKLRWWALGLVGSLVLLHLIFH